jgi:DNA-binding NarL/FixJ family response regulator
MAAFLVVEDEPLVLRTVTQTLRPFGKVEAAMSLREAMALLEKPKPWLGFVVDLQLPDGDGISWLGEARRKFPLVPAAIYTARTEPAAINRAALMRVAYLCKPALSELKAFGNAAILLQRGLEGEKELALEEYAQIHGLSAAELAIVRAAFQGERRESILEQRDISPNTYRTQVSSILRKTEKSDVPAVCTALWELVAQRQHARS